MWCTTAITASCIVSYAGKAVPASVFRTPESNGCSASPPIAQSAAKLSGQLVAHQRPAQPKSACSALSTTSQLPQTYPFDRREPRAQALLVVDHVGQGRTQCVGIELTAAGAMPPARL